MPQRAQVTSVDAIDSFRASLIIYLSKARPTLEEVTADVLRMRLWLENDQRTHWENQVRKRTKELEQAQAALFSSRISNLQEESAAEQQGFHRARRALDEAQTKLRISKKWAREFDSQAQPLVKQMEKLQTIFANDMVLAVAYLAQAVNTLEAYAGIAPPAVTVGPAEAGATQVTGGSAASPAEQPVDPEASGPGPE
jgi:hypothetical protein